jgi:nucleoside-diphosphate-sugar epimerase
MFACIADQLLTASSLGTTSCLTMLMRCTLQCYWGVDPVPLPLHGDQFTTLTHAEDVASMLAAVIDNPAAVGQVSESTVITSGYTSVTQLAVQ